MFRGEKTMNQIQIKSRQHTNFHKQFSWHSGSVNSLSGLCHISHLTLYWNIITADHCWSLLGLGGQHYWPFPRFITSRLAGRWCRQSHWPSYTDLQQGQTPGTRGTGRCCPRCSAGQGSCSSWQTSYRRRDGGTHQHHNTEADHQTWFGPGNIAL